MKEYNLHVTELQLQDLEKQVERLEEKVRKISLVIDDIWSKSMVCNCMLVVRKVDADKREELKSLLD